MSFYNSASLYSYRIDLYLPYFILTKVNTLVKWDLVHFFHKNPHTAETAENIAAYTARDGSTVTDELADLAEAGVLQLTEVSGRKIYVLTEDAAMRELIHAFVLACDDRDFRVKAIRQITDIAH